MARRTLLLAIATLLIAVTAACGGGNGENPLPSSSNDQLTDPRSVPTATPWATTPEPIFVDAAQPGSPAPGGRSNYVVQSGDTPIAIAERFGVSVQELMRINNITDPTALRVGQELIIPGQQQATATPTSTPRPGTSPTSTPGPGGQRTYTVQPGDYLSRIAQQFGVTVPDIQRANNLGSDTTIFPGQILVIPTPTPAGQ